MDTPFKLPPGFLDAIKFPLSDALFGRRSRRFALGNEIPEGPLKFHSQHPPLPLTDLEEMLLLAAASGNTGWHYMIPFSSATGPRMPNYSSGASGRTFPSAAGWQTGQIFFTNDHGVFLFDTRDAPPVSKAAIDTEEGMLAFLDGHRNRIKKLQEGRIDIPRREPYITAHNHWSVNVPGSTFLIPVADLAQHLLSLMCWVVKNGYSLYDDIHGQKIPGLEKFKHLIDVDSPWMLSVVEQFAVVEATSELSISCFAGQLMLQAMGLGGWMHDGINKDAVLGGFSHEGVKGLGFNYTKNEKTGLPNFTGLTGVFEAFCPPNFTNMRGALDALEKRRFGENGPFHKETPGPWKESALVRGSAEPFSEEFKECVSLMAQYVYDHFGKFPATLPTCLVATFLQAHHLDLDFYDHHFKDGAYLCSHKEHMEKWHGK